jgi:hypothetical protein
MNVGSPTTSKNLFTFEPINIQLGQIDDNLKNILLQNTDIKEYIKQLIGDSREKINQKINEIVYHPVYKNYLILFLLCDTGHDGEYNAIEQNPLITYYINLGVDFGELNNILGSFGYSLPDNFPKNQEGLKKLENNSEIVRFEFSSNPVRVPIESKYEKLKIRAKNCKWTYKSKNIIS